MPHVEDVPIKDISYLKGLWAPLWNFFPYIISYPEEGYVVAAVGELPGKLFVDQVRKVFIFGHIYSSNYNSSKYWDMCVVREGTNEIYSPLENT